MSRTQRARRCAAAVAGLCVLLAAGCGSGGGDAVSTADPTSATSETTPIATTSSTASTTTTPAPTDTADQAAIAAFLESRGPATGSHDSASYPAPSGNGGSGPARGSGGSGATDGSPPVTAVGAPFAAPTVTAAYTCIDSFPTWGFHVVVTASGGSGWRLNDVSAPGGVISTADIYVHQAGGDVPPGGFGNVELTRHQDYSDSFPFYAVAGGSPVTRIPVSASMNCTFHP